MSFLDSTAMFFLQLWVLTWEDMREMLFRRRAVLTLSLYFGLLVLSLWMIVKIQSQLGATGDVFSTVMAQNGEFDQVLDQLGILQYKSFFEYLAKTPNSLWIFQLFSLLWYPVMITLMSYDMIALDANRGTLRYLIQRTNRAVYFLAKFLSHSLVYIFLQITAVIALLIICANKVKEFSAGIYLEMAFRYCLIFIPFILCIVAATAWISSTTNKASTALIRVHLIWILFVVILARFPGATPLEQENMIGIMMPAHGYGMHALLSLSTWTFGFLLVGMIPFCRKDL